MPKKITRTRRRLPKKIELEAVPFDKIDLAVQKEEEVVAKSISNFEKKIRSIFADNRSLTKAEFAKFFIIPFLTSFLLLLFILFHFASSESSKVASTHVRPSFPWLSAIASAPLRLFTPDNKLKGQETFDPFQVKLDIDKGSFFYALIDLRSRQEFEKGHIRDAVNIPAYIRFSDLKNLELSEKDILKETHNLLKTRKPIVLYSFTRDSQLTHDVAAILKRNGYQVSSLGVGWNEWRHFTNIWVPEAGWDDFRIDNYIDGENKD